jgi:hypothetical protein
MQKFKTYLFSVALLLILPGAVSAYQTDRVQVGAGANDFVVGSGKVELTLRPGESKTVNLTATNRLGSTRDFTIETEDFTGSTNLQETVILLGKDRGPFSLKDSLYISEKTFRLENGERATIPVRVTVPANAQPGGLYGSVVISVLPKTTVDNSEAGQTASKSSIITRIGSLFFVTVPGEVKLEGALKEFGIAGTSNVVTQGQVKFRLLYENTGNMYLKPFGKISIKNMFGQSVSTIDVDPWFAMPRSLRSREVVWPRDMLFGRYTASASIDRGYGIGNVDNRSVSFWVFPMKQIVIVLLAIVLLVVFVRWLLSHFEISRK